MNNKEEKEFQCLCCQTLSKPSPVFTSDYTPLYEEECGDYDTSNVNWGNEYHDNNHYTPIQLIALFRKFLEVELKKSNIPDNRINLYKHLIEECYDWTEDETTYMEG